jgi:hypothetical protein
MKKNSKRDEKRMMVAQLSALTGREAETLVIGIDLGDRTSTYCVRSANDQQVLLEGAVETKAQSMVDAFGQLRRQRMVMETGTHSRWI